MANKVNPLAKLDAANKALIAAKSLGEVKKILDLSKAAATYARAAKLGLEAQNHAAEITLRAERKAGDLLAKLERGAGGDKKSKNQIYHRDKFDSEYAQTLQEQDITYQTAAKWQMLATLPESDFEKYLSSALGREKEITTSEALRLAREIARQAIRGEIAHAVLDVEVSERWHVYEADFSEWDASQQYDFIITDPPYPREYLHLYGVLAQRSKFLLREGGLLVVMCGQSYLDTIYKAMSEHLDYYWTAAYLTPGQPTPLRQVNVNSSWKPLLIFRKGEYKGKIFGDVFSSDSSDKRFHDWGQSESGMLSIISGICLPGQLILDPFCGGGSTLVAAIRHGCLADGVDIDKKCVETAKVRLSSLEVGGSSG